MGFWISEWANVGSECEQNVNIWVSEIGSEWMGVWVMERVGEYVSDWAVDWVGEILS